jgi:hypothetical protein
MQNYKRRSPLRFAVPPAKTAARRGWEVALSFPGDDGTPVVVDLSHAGKWELYARGLEGRQVGPAVIPATPGQVTLTADLAVSLCRPSVALIWQLSENALPALPAGVDCTEITDGIALMALIGEDVLRVFEKVSDLDLALPADQTVGFVQGPVLDTPAQAMVLSDQDTVPGVLLAVARGYGQSVLESLMDAGAQFGLQPAGEQRFQKWLNSRPALSSAGPEGTP